MYQPLGGPDSCRRPEPCDIFDPLGAAPAPHEPAMPGTGEKGSFAADIPASVLEEALKSVAKHESGDPGDPPPEAPVQVEVPGPDLAAEVSRLETELAD